MDCCENTKQNKKNEDKEESMKGGKSMAEINKKTVLWIVVGVLLIATIFLTFKASSGAAQATVSAAKTAASTASSGMVGGC